MITKVYLWPFEGYILRAIPIPATDEPEQALEEVANVLTNDGLKEFYFTQEEVEAFYLDDGDFDGDVYEYAEQTGLIYIDGMMTGATEPIYISGENLKFGYN